MTRPVLTALIAALACACAAPPINPYGPCKASPPVDIHGGRLPIVGAEDLEVVPTRPGEPPRLIVSATDRRGGSTGIGGVFSIPILADGRLGAPVRFERPCPTCLANPHGLSLLRDGPRLLLFVIEHGEPERVGVYTVEGDTLSVFGPPLVHDLLTDPNDVLALAPDRVLVTNMTSTHSGFARGLAWLLPVWRGFIADFVLAPGAPPTWHGAKIASPVRLANGIAVDADSEILLVSELAQRRVGRFAFPADRGGDPLERAGEPIRLSGRPDNIAAGEEGSFLVAVHPNAFSFLLHSLFRSVDAPTRVYRIRSTDQRGARVFEHRGEAFDGASVAAERGAALYLGQIYGPNVYSCTR